MRRTAITPRRDPRRQDHQEGRQSGLVVSLRQPGQGLSTPRSSTSAVRTRANLAFGAGIHRCVGARGRSADRILWEELLRRFERVEVTIPGEIGLDLHPRLYRTRGQDTRDDADNERDHHASFLIDRHRACSRAFADRAVLAERDLEIPRLRGRRAEMARAGLEPAIGFNIATIAVQLAASLFIISGRHVWLGAAVLIMFTGLTIPLVHHFWAMTASPSDDRLSHGDRTPRAHWRPARGGGSVLAQWSGTARANLTRRVSRALPRRARPARCGPGQLYAAPPCQAHPAAAVRRCNHARRMRAPPTPSGSAARHRPACAAFGRAQRPHGEALAVMDGGAGGSRDHPDGRVGGKRGSLGRFSTENTAFCRIV